MLIKEILFQRLDFLSLHSFPFYMKSNLWEQDSINILLLYYFLSLLENLMSNPNTRLYTRFDNNIHLTTVYTLGPHC